jgi:hypothetical protein
MDAISVPMNVQPPKVQLENRRPKDNHQRTVTKLQAKMEERCLAFHMISKYPHASPLKNRVVFHQVPSFDNKETVRIT